MSEFDPRPAHDPAPEPSVDADLETDPAELAELADFADDDFFDDVELAGDEGDSAGGSLAAAELHQAAEVQEAAEAEPVDLAEATDDAVAAGGPVVALRDAAGVADAGDVESASSPAADVAPGSGVGWGSGVGSGSGSGSAAAASDSSVGAALAALDTLSERELREHPDVYQRIHAELQSALSAIDDA